MKDRREKMREELNCLHDNIIAFWERGQQHDKDYFEQITNIIDVYLTALEALTGEVQPVAPVLCDSCHKHTYGSPQAVSVDELRKVIVEAEEEHCKTFESGEPINPRVVDVARAIHDRVYGGGK